MFDYQTWPSSTGANASLPGSPNSSDTCLCIPSLACPGLPHLLISIWLVKQHGFAVQLPVLVAFYISEFFGEFPVVGQTSRFIKCVCENRFSWTLNGMISIFFVHPRLLRTHSVAIISDQTSVQRFMLSWVLQSPMAKITILKWLQWPQKRASQANMMVVNGGFNDQTRGV